MQSHFITSGGSREQVSQHPSSLMALLMVPNLPLVISADCVTPNVKEDALSTGDRHPHDLCPFPSVALWCVGGLGTERASGKGLDPVC